MSYYIRLNKAKTRYYGIVYYVDREGKRHQKSTPTFQYKREAKEKAIQLENELNRLNMELGEITFVDYWERWFNTFKINKAKSTSARNQYRIMLKFIK